MAQTREPVGQPDLPGPDRRRWPRYLFSPEDPPPRAEVSEIPGEVRIEDLCVEGVGMLLPGPVTIGQPLTLRLDPGDAGPWVEVPAVVVYILPHRTGCRAGALFSRLLTEDERRRLL